MKRRKPMSLTEATAILDAKRKKPVVSSKKPYRKSKHCDVYPTKNNTHP